MIKQKAFTLIELLVVVAIIGILAAVGVVAYNGYTKSAKEKTTEINFKNINKSLMIEFMKCELDSANIGKKDGSDDYLYAEFNFCEF